MAKNKKSSPAPVEAEIVSGGGDSPVIQAPPSKEYVLTMDTLHFGTITKTIQTNGDPREFLQGLIRGSSVIMEEGPSYIAFPLSSLRSLVLAPKGPQA